MITAKTKLIGILGYPVEHSVSPDIQNAAFAAAKLDYAYLPLPVKPGKLEEAVAGLKAMNFIGANVTIPHKVAVMEYLDEIDTAAQIIGAVNTVVLRDGKCIGYNTDALGFIKSLQAKNVSLTGKQAVLLGAGGAARAVVCGLLQNGLSKITIATRNKAKAEKFALSFSSAKVTGIDWDSEAWDSKAVLGAIKTADLLVNCTPLGMYPYIDNEPPVNWDNVNPNAVICDLIYNPAMTKFLDQARKRGHQLLNGSGMLVEQGALAFELWTDKPAPRNDMYFALNSVL